MQQPYDSRPVDQALACIRRMREMVEEFESLLDDLDERRWQDFLEEHPELTD